MWKEISTFWTAVLKKKQKKHFTYSNLEDIFFSQIIEKWTYTFFFFYIYLLRQHLPYFTLPIPVYVCDVFASWKQPLCSVSTNFQCFCVIRAVHAVGHRSVYFPLPHRAEPYSCHWQLPGGKTRFFWMFLHRLLLFWVIAVLNMLTLDVNKSNIRKNEEKMLFERSSRDVAWNDGNRVCGLFSVHPVALPPLRLCVFLMTGALHWSSLS